MQLKKKTKKKPLKQTATVQTNVPGMGNVGGVPGVPTGLQSAAAAAAANMAAVELGKKRMRDPNDDLLMVPQLLHGVHFRFSISISLSISLFITRVEFCSEACTYTKSQVFRKHFLDSTSQQIFTLTVVCIYF